jgi:hypothetical protein
MNRWLNIGITSACFGIFVSLSDFFLTSARKKKLEDFIDTITLRLDYTRTLDWLQRWLKASRRASIAAIFFAVVSVVAALVFLIAVEWEFWEDFSWWELIGIGIIALIVWIWQWGYVEKAYESVGDPIVEWLAASDSYGSLIGGYLLVIFGGGLLLGLCFLALYGVAYLAENWSIVRMWRGIGGNFVFGLMLCWIGIIIDGIVTMIGALVVFVLRTIVDSARWIMWRISNYPKGPLTATLTVVGAVLATVKIFISK